MNRALPEPRLNRARIVEFAEFVKTLSIGLPLNFYSISDGRGGTIVLKDDYPPLGVPWAIDFFFIVGVHQYGFWHGENKYEGPLYGTLNGKKVKGSDLLWKLILREFRQEPRTLSGAWLSFLKEDHWKKMMSDDNGPVPLLATRARWHLSRNLGLWFAKQPPHARMGRGWMETYTAKNCSRPATLMLQSLTNEKFGAPGFRDDPLNKKALLFMMTLANRPERFLVPESDFVWEPIVDYHLMRLALRIGLVDIPDEWHYENVHRTFTTPTREEAIRREVYHAISFVIKKSGRTMAEIDNLMWSGRRFCPETETPRCDSCILRNACAKRTELFQPVIRTTLY